MSHQSPQRRDSDGRAARRLGGVVLALAIAVAAGGWLGPRLGPWGPDASARRPGEAVGDRGAATGSVEPSAVGAGRGAPGSVTARPDPMHGGDGGLGERDGHRDLPGSEDMLTLLDHMENQLAAVVERARESVVALEYTANEASDGERRVASGVVINDHGEILSVRIDPPQAGPAGRPGAADKKGRDPLGIVARDYLGHPHFARWVAADPHTGLTLLRVSRGAVRPIKPAADGPKLASQVFVLGNPFGMQHSVNRGHIAGLDRVLELGPRQLGGLIQVQAPLYPGDSGAAVVDLRGGWLGLIRGGLAIPGAVARSSAAPDPAATGKAISPRAADRRDAANDAAGRADDAAEDPSAEPDTDFGFAIPTRDALWIAEQLRTHRRVDRAYLGVHLEEMPVSDGTIPALEPPPSAPAASSSSTSAAGPGAPGAWRGGGGAADSSGDSPKAVAATTDPDPPPVVVAGARIYDVVPGSPAEQAGLRPGDRIVALDGQPIRSRSHLIDRLERIPARKRIVLGVVSGDGATGRRREVTVRTARRPAPPGSVPGTGPGVPPEPRPGGAGVVVTPTASRVEPAAPGATPVAPTPSPPPAGGSGPSLSAPGEPRPDPPAASPPPSAPRSDAAPPPAPAPAAPDHAEPPPTAAGSSPSLGELKVTLPRAVVERIEHLERRIDELEQFRTGSGARGGGIGEGDSRAQSAAPSRERERAVRLARPSPP